MRLHRFVAAVQLPLLVCSYNPFKGATQVIGQKDGAEYPMRSNASKLMFFQEVSTSVDFNPDELLSSRLRKPEIFTKAMLELKRLEEEPTCHRLAVKLLMNNCQGLEHAGENEYDHDKGHLQKHHVESFAASLAICDLERGRFVIPHACQLFTGSTLYRVSQDGKGKLQVSPEQVGECLEALGQDHSHWNTWLSYRDKALLFCRAARFDIDKDQAIQHHQKLIQIMSEFADKLDADLNYIEKKMAEHHQSTNSYFEGLKSHLCDLGTEVRDTMAAVSKDITGYVVAVKSSLKNTEDLDRMLKGLFQTMAEGNAEMAAEQEHALEVAANYAKLQMQHLNTLTGETGATISELRTSVHQLFPVIVSLSRRQDDLDQRSGALYAAMNNITVLLQNHTEYLELANTKASTIYSTLDQAALSASSWNQNLAWGGSLGNCALRITTPLATLILGNYGLPPSFTRNAVLLLGGIGFGEVLVQFRHVDWTWLRVLMQVSSSPTAFTHLAREQLIWSPTLITPDTTT